MADHDDIELTRTHRASDRPASPSPLGTWGEFILVRELGHGAFGYVFHARDETLARDIALKIVKLPDPAHAAAALHEGRMLARVRHRNVVTVYGASRIGDEVGMWMELIHGKHLSQIVREQGKLGPEEATVVGISVCQALAAVHASGLLHRDVKANNVMRESGGRIVLTDFGTGRDVSVASEEDFAGTPVCMAPEVLAGESASAASDIYSLGVLLFFVVTGEYPLRGPSVLDLLVAHRAGKRRLLSDVRPDLPEGFVRVVERALAPRPEDRYESAGAMMRALAEALPSSSSWEGRLARALSQAGAEPSLLLRDGAPTPVTTGRLLARASLAAAAGFLAIGALGFLTSAAFNQALGRDDFDVDGVVDWWTYGARSIVAPLVLAAVVLFLAAFTLTIGRGLRRLIQRRSAGATSETTRRRPLPTAALAQWLLVGQVTAVLAIGWHYRHFLEAVGSPGDAPASFVVLLSTDSATPWVYRSLLTIFLTAMLAGWQSLLSRPGASLAIPRTTTVAGGAVVVCAVLMLEVPYRLLYHSDFKRVTFAGAHCHELGKNTTEVLLYCADDAPPRIQRVTRTDTRLLPAGVTVTESIFQANRE